MVIPALRFEFQDTALPIPNLNTSLLQGYVAILISTIAVQPLDFVNVNMSSGVAGGSYNLSFEVGIGAAFIQIFIPIRFITPNSGKTVRLLLGIRRAGMAYSAPDATVFIDGSVIVVPTPGTLWDFSDGTFQGWIPQGNYVGGVLKIIGGRVVVDRLDSQPGKSHIITRPIQVTAGRTYDFAFDVSASNPADGSTLYMTINGARIGANVLNITQTQQTGTGSFTATTTGNVTLGIFNDAVPQGRHRLSLGNIRMTQRP